LEASIEVKILALEGFLEGLEAILEGFASKRHLGLGEQRFHD
jgi:hypothetical protein